MRVRPLLGEKFLTVVMVLLATWFVKGTSPGGRRRFEEFRRHSGE